MRTEIQPLPASLTGWGRERCIEAREARIERMEELTSRPLAELGAEEAREMKRLNDENERLVAEMPNPHPGHPKPSRGRSRRTQGRRQFSSFGHEILDSLTQGGKLMAALDVTVGGTSSPSFFDPDLREMPQRRLFLRDLIPTRSVTSDKVDFVRQTVNTHAAAAVALGAVKPKSTYSIERVTADVRTIAHLSEEIDRALLADYDAVADFIDNVLVIGVLLEEEDQILNGSGTAPNLRGILNVVGISTQAKGADPHFDAVFKAITKVRLDNFEPDGIVLHPNDWEEVRLTRTADGNYIHGDPIDAGEERLFDKRVVVSPLIAQGTGLVGAFGEGCTVYDREAARVTFTETGLGDTAGEDLFQTNQVRFRGESRIAFGTAFPKAFCQVTGI